MSLFFVVLLVLVLGHVRLVGLALLVVLLVLFVVILGLVALILCLYLL